MSSVKDSPLLPTSITGAEIRALSPSTGVLCGRCDSYVDRIAAHHQHEGMHCAACLCVEVPRVSPSPV
jgi:hypothetical protein